MSASTCSAQERSNPIRRHLLTGRRKEDAGPALLAMNAGLLTGALERGTLRATRNPKGLASFSSAFDGFRLPVARGCQRSTRTSSVRTNRVRSPTTDRSRGRRGERSTASLSTRTPGVQARWSTGWRSKSGWRCKLKRAAGTRLGLARGCRGRHGHGGVNDGSFTAARGSGGGRGSGDLLPGPLSGRRGSGRPRSRRRRPRRSRRRRRRPCGSRSRGARRRPPRGGRPSTRPRGP
jgi:hypothetical protein